MGASLTDADESGKTPLHVAVSCDQPSIVRLLLDHMKGTDLEKEGSAVLTGCALGKTNLVKLMISKGCPTTALDSEDSSYTCLHHAARIGDAVLIGAIAAKGRLNVNSPDEDGNTPLHVASAGGHGGMVIPALLACGADIQGRNEDGDTPLHCAVGAALVVLLAKGACVHARNDHFYCPLHTACLRQDIESAQVLIKSGAWTDIHVHNNEEVVPLELVRDLSAREQLSKYVDICAASTIQLSPPPKWQEDGSTCQQCQCTFSVSKRRHHCRGCGRTLCADCSCHKLPLPFFKFPKAVRVCERCLTDMVGPARE